MATAAADTKTLLLQVDASVELLRRGLADGSKTVDKFDREARRVLDRFDGRFSKVGEKSMPVLQQRIVGVATSVKALAAGIGGFGVGAAGSKFLQLADQAKQMEAQLRLATAESGNFARAQADVERISATTRIGLSASTALYGTLLRAAAPLGRTQADAALATETFAKALKVGGASAEAASSATLQFSQALASGVLRGDEFNSIAEASPRILRLLADALGVPQSQLRNLAEEGQLTADKLYGALTNIKVTGSLDAEFKQLPVTMSEAMQLVEDAAVKTAGAFDRGSELSKAIVSLVTDGADGFGSLARAGENAGQDLRATFFALRDLFQPMETSADQAFGEIEGGIGTLREAVAGLLDLLDVIPNQAVRFTNNVNSYSNSVKGFVRSYAPGFVASRVSADVPMIGEFTNGAIFRQNAERARLYQNAGNLDRSLGERFGGISRNDDGTLNLGIRRTAPRPAPRAAGSGSKSGKGGAKKAAAPFKLKAFDLDGVSSPVEIAEAAERYAQARQRAVEAVLGKDAIGDLIAGYNAEIAARIDGKTKVAEANAPKGAIADYRAELAALAADTDQALQGVAVNGLRAVEDGFVGIITGTQSVKDAFKQMAASIIADLARIALQKAILSAIGGGFADGGRIGDGPRFADGGSTGGLIRGPGTGRSDSILALLSNGKGPIRVSAGEFIMNERATRANLPFLQALNAGRLRGYADGGALSALPMRAPSISMAGFARSRDSISAPVSIAIDARGADSEGLARVEKQLADLNRSLPGRIVSTVADARERRILR